MKKRAEENLQKRKHQTEKEAYLVYLAVCVGSFYYL
jgi:hypothetical protein